MRLLASSDIGAPPGAGGRGELLRIVTRLLVLGRKRKESDSEPATPPVRFIRSTRGGGGARSTSHVPFLTTVSPSACTSSCSYSYY